MLRYLGKVRAAVASGVENAKGVEGLRVALKLLFKQFVFSESRGSAFEFRVDAFNAWNHTQFGGAGQNGGFHTGFDGGQAGQITSAFDPRTLQLGAKLIF